MKLATSDDGKNWIEFSPITEQRIREIIAFKNTGPRPYSDLPDWDERDVIAVAVENMHVRLGLDKPKTEQP